MKPITLSIPQPCHENWNDMSPVEKGRFCDSCQKKVFDFTTSSDREIMETFASKDKVCGRFKASQLNRTLVAPRKNSLTGIAAGAAFISIFASHQADAQVKGEPRVEICQPQIMGKPLSMPPVTVSVKGRTVAEGLPLPGVSISIDGNIIDATSDADGNFEIKCHPDAVLYFSYLGYETQELQLNGVSKEGLVIDFKEENQIMLGDADIVVVGGAISYNRYTNFPRRLWHRIRNWFR